MNRSKIERYILSKNHVKHPNLIFGLTMTSSLLIVLSLLLILFNK
jgi:hypothetical protein